MTKRDATLVQGGKFYLSTDAGLIETPAATADLVVCRRLSNYPAWTVPPGGVVGQCVRCAAPIVMDPAAPVGADVPRVCMQCAGFVPLPME